MFFILKQPPLPKPRLEDSKEIRVAHKKREEDDEQCRGHILNLLSDHLYDLFCSIKSPRDIWYVLEEKYMTEKRGRNHF